MTEKDMKLELGKLSKPELIRQILLRNDTINKLSKALDDKEDGKDKNYASSN